MSDLEKLAVYRRVLAGCGSVFAGVPERWRVWSDLSLRERQDYMLYEIDDATRLVSEIEADRVELGDEERALLAAAKRQRDEVKPVLEQMERSFDGVQDADIEAA